MTRVIRGLIYVFAKIVPRNLRGANVAEMWRERRKGAKAHRLRDVPTAAFEPLSLCASEPF
jgi:hypothetical protein